MVANFLAKVGFKQGAVVGICEGAPTNRKSQRKIMTHTTPWNAFLTAGALMVPPSTKYMVPSPCISPSWKSPVCDIEPRAVTQSVLWTNSWHCNVTLRCFVICLVKPDSLAWTKVTSTTFLASSMTGVRICRHLASNNVG